jgi:hypothetical protein
LAYCKEVIEKNMIKLFKHLQPFTLKLKEKPKYCSTCGELATQEACFDVGDGVTIIEKYCDACAEKNGR